MKRKRAAEVHFYEWSVSRWRTSSTRSILDATGRGIYRELLDACYTQGTILNPEKDPAYLEALARDCAVTTDVFEAVWKLIRRHFSVDKKDPSRLTNKQADCVRREYFSYVEGQRKHGKSGGREKSGRRKLAESETSVGEPKASLGLPFRESLANGNGNITAIQTAREKHPPTPFDPELSFAELWHAYPAKGRTKLIDAQRWYVEAITPDPERIHSAMLASIQPGGKWAASDAWARGFVPGLSEWLRNRRWVEDPEPYDESRHGLRNASNGRLEMARQTLAEVDLSDVETAY